jgi:signal transduction histidine kinase
MVLSEKAGPLNDKQQKMLHEAAAACGRLAALVEDLGVLGKLESQGLALARKDVDLAELLSEVASGMHEGDDRGVQLEVRRPDDPAMVTGDRARLAAALSALLRSALREHGAPGVVVAQCSIADNATTRWALVTIGDDSLLTSLAASWHTPPAFNEWLGGLGFALPTARRIIEAHGGAVWSADGSASKAASALRLPLRV